MHTTRSDSGMFRIPSVATWTKPIHEFCEEPTLTPWGVTPAGDWVSNVFRPVFFLVQWKLLGWAATNVRTHCTCERSNVADLKRFILQNSLLLIQSLFFVQVNELIPWYRRSYSPTWSSGIRLTIDIFSLWSPRDTMQPLWTCVEGITGRWRRCCSGQIIWKGKQKENRRSHTNPVHSE